MMSDTVNMPAKHDFSLFHNGAETTPEGYSTIQQTLVRSDTQQMVRGIPLDRRQVKAFLTSSLESRTMRRKLTGNESYDVRPLR